MPRLRRLFGLVTVVTALWAASASHYPVFVEEIDAPGLAQAIDDIDRSWAFYGRLSADQVDYYEFSGEAGDTLDLEVLVPKRDQLDDFRPVLFVAGEGFEGECPSGNGGCARVPTNAAPASVYEGFSQSYFWSYGMPDPDGSRTTLPADGTYELLVTSDRGEGGPYAIVGPGSEGFRPLDFILFPLDWVRVHLWYFS